MTDNRDERERFAEAVGMVACGWESLPEAAERRGVEPVQVAQALSRHQYRSDYNGLLWADRHRDDMTEHERETIDERIDEIEDESRRHSTEDTAEELGIDLDCDDDDAETADESSETLDDFPGGIEMYDPEEVVDENPEPDEL